MSLPELPKTNDRRELRKAMVRLRLEMHRQEIRHEAGNALQPLTRLRSMGDSLQGGLGVKHAPLWGIGAVVLLGFITGKGARSGNLARLTSLTSSLLPLIRLFMQQPPKRP
ncbi:MAG: hypothetical protein LBJ37_26640 [Paucimonas sp.]|jgi:hypothetical protein|nr:hypothetical protein [Paucimonas sp.]